MPTAPKSAPSRRRARAIQKPFAGRLGHTPMTLDVKLIMAPVYAMLESSGFDWRQIPEDEFRIAVEIWKRDRIARGQWRVEWQSDGEAFLLAYAHSHRWKDEDVLDRFLVERQTRKPGDMTDAQRDAMGYTAWMEQDKCD